ncbi:phage holin [Clostridium aminobutyricum]|uniref:Phage holin n=1 Tax=Clostridium aminobutyricum TaxID=33953 RepID=A0A939D6D1_CLOAM|nr:phage holin [Clostridium aminobutyricum]MBN7771856.1 phage holin [Clostridium aminobutyricum]
MNINWKLRVMNKITITALLACVVTFIYQVLSIVGITPAVSENQITDIIGVVLNLLVAIGIVVDPTTKGISDSERALAYKQPN